MRDPEVGFASSDSYTTFQMPGELSLPNSEKTVALPDNLEAEFDRVKDKSESSVKMVSDDACITECPASKQKLTSF
jgi:hypothetical protein